MKIVASKTQNDMVNGVIALPKVCRGVSILIRGENDVMFEFMGTGVSISLKSGESISHGFLDNSFSAVSITGTAPDFLMLVMK